jgi:Carboxypeptidase regulatory-like domain/TonB dependent receptor-like, beta-barrel/TonB-dependent Receptor Plug Domain
MKFRWLSAALVLICLTTVIGMPALAQTTGSVEGTITDSSNSPLPGASVELKSPALQGTRVAVTNADGRYRFPALPPGNYMVTASLSGFKKVERPNVHVSLDATATIPIKMEISVSQEIVVTGEAPVVDTTSTTGGINIRQDIAQKLPLGRNYSSVIAINPGVSTDNAETQGRAQAFTIYGSTSVENQYLVDGVNTTNVIKGFQGKALSQEFIEEVQVKTSGYEAEYGRATGGIINVVTKSGGNEFHGDGFGYFNRKSLTADYKGFDTDRTSLIDTTQENREDFGLDLGGFLMKDRIWFFGAYNRVNRNESQIPVGGLNKGKDFPLVFHTNIYSGKMTFRLTEGTTLVGTVFGDPETREGTLANYNSLNPIIQQATREVGATDWSASLSQLFGTVGLVNARFSQHKDRFELTGKANDAQLVDSARVTDAACNSANPCRLNGFGSIFGPTNNNRSRRNQFKGDGTVFVSAHEIKGGVDFEDNLTETTSYYTGGQVVTARCAVTVPSGSTCPAANVYYQHSFYTNGGPTGGANAADAVTGYLPGGNVANPKTSRLGFFLQDTFKPIPNLTINAGIRYDSEDVKDYSGTTVIDLKNEWQPRIGIAWDVMKDGSSKLSASYGRFYYALPTDLNVRAFGAQLIAVSCNFSATALDQAAGCPRAFQIQGGAFTEPVQGTSGLPGDEPIKGIYQDEVTLGFDKAIDPTFALGARATYRTLGRTIEDRCDFDPGYPEANNNTCVILNPGSDSPFSTGQGVHTCDGRDYPPFSDEAANNPAQSQCASPATTGVSIPKAKRQYIGLELVAKKQVSNVLWAQASLVFSQLKGNYDGAARVGDRVTGQTDPGINADYDYALFSQNAYGKLVLDRPVSFRLDTAYTTPFGLQVGFQGYVRSGAPINRITYFNSQYGPEIYVDPRGSDGRQPTEYEINLSLGYAIKLNPVTVTLFAQGFNLINKQIVTRTEFAETLNPPGEDTNPDYGKPTSRTDPRSIRLGARVSF